MATNSQSNLVSVLTDIATAINAKGVSGPMTAYEMPSKIMAITTGVEWGEISGALSDQTDLYAEISALSSDKSYYVITEDVVTVETEDTKGVSPYNTSYYYTNITIDENSGIKWKEGATYAFVVNTTLVVSSNYRNVRVRIGTNDSWHPVCAQSSTVATGSTYFIKSRNDTFIYKTTQYSYGALHLNSGSDTTYSYLQNLIAVGGVKIDTAGYGARYSYLFATTPLSAPVQMYSSLVKSSSTDTSKAAATPSTGKFYIDRKPVYNYSSNITAGATNTATLFYDYYTSDLRYIANVNSTYATASKPVYLWLKNFDESDMSFVSDASLGQLLTVDKLSTKFPASTSGYVYLYLMGYNTATWYTFTPTHNEECRIFRYNPATKEMVSIESTFSTGQIRVTDSSIGVVSRQVEDLSVLKVTQDEYKQYLNDYTRQELSNCVFFVSADYADMCGSRVTNVGTPALSSDAANKYYVDSHQNYDMNGNRLQNVGTPTADTDAATKEYVDNNVPAVTVKTLTNIQVLRPESISSLFLSVQVYSDPALTTQLTSLNSANSSYYQYFYGYKNVGTSSSWDQATASGFDETYAHFPVLVKLKSLTLAEADAYYVKYTWYTNTSGTLHHSDPYSLVIPSVTEVGANAGMISYILSQLSSLQNQINTL